jgi:multidrug efflux pump subunit AcrA (membrane-fusion protein)
MRHGWFLCCVMSVMVLTSASSALGDADDDDKPAAANSQAKFPDLSEQQARAVGIMVGRPLATKVPDHTEASGLVLDATQLLADLGQMEAADAAEHAASAELARLHQLFSGGGSASQRAIEAAQFEQVKSRIEAQSATARVDLHWGPIASLPPAARGKLLEASASGRSLLVRAELPGLHSLGALPAKAMLDVDGVQVPGRVLGVLTQASDTQGVALLVEVTHAPVGLGPGARIPVDLMTPPRAGFLLPRDAVLYDESGAYVYKRLSRKTDAEKWQYATIKVSLLQPSGDGWLVQGIDDDDDVVVRGAGVLWSMQDAGSHAVDDDDD